jgi:hypothetical protein
MRLEQALAKRSKADAALADLMTKLHGLDVEADDYASTCSTIKGQIARHKSNTSCWLP